MHQPVLRGTVILYRDDAIENRTITYATEPPIAAVYLGALTIQTSDPVALEQLADAVLEAARELREALTEYAAHVETSAEVQP